MDTLSIINHFRQKSLQIWQIPGEEKKTNINIFAHFFQSDFRKIKPTI